MQKKKATKRQRKTNDANLDVLIQQLEALEAEAGREKTSTETRKYLIHIYGTMTRAATVWNQLTMFPDRDPEGRERELQGLAELPALFEALTQEALEAVHDLETIG